MAGGRTEGWAVAQASNPEGIVGQLRQVEVLVGQGKLVAEAIRAIGVTQATYYRWRAEHGGLQLDQVRRLQLLEPENGRLRWAASDLTREQLILKEAASGNFQAPRVTTKSSHGRRRAGVLHVAAELGVSQRLACRVDAFSRACLAIRVGRKLGSTAVIDVLSDLFITRGTPAYIRSDNGPEFGATAVRAWITGLSAKPVYIEPVYIEPGSPWENGYLESFNGKFRDERRACEAFNTLAQARVLIEQWRRHYNTVRPHSAWGYRPPAPEVVLSRVPMPAASPGPAGSAAALGIMPMN